MTACTFLEVAPPTRVASRDGLIATLQREGVAVNGDGHWIGGIQFRPDSCGGGGIHLSVCEDDEDTCGEKVFNRFHDPVKWKPYLIFSSVSCATFSDSDEVRQSAINAYNISAPVIAASELYYGLANKEEVLLSPPCDDGSDFPSNPYLADPAQDFPTGTDTTDWTTAVVVDPVGGLSLIVDYIAATAAGVESVIHVSPGLAATWDALDLITRGENGNWRTYIGNHLVIPAPGYHGSTPFDGLDGHSPGLIYPGVSWAYVTGPVALYLGDLSSSDTLDHRRNNYFTVVEQYVLPYFDPTCPRFGIPIVNNCPSPDIDFSDETDAIPVIDIHNDHLLYCVDEGGGQAGEPFDPDIFVGVDYAPESS